MSGGHFNDCGYEYYKVSQFADELEHEILNNGREGTTENGYEWYPNHDPDVIDVLKEQIPKLRKMAETLWLCWQNFMGIFQKIFSMPSVKQQALI